MTTECWVQTPTTRYPVVVGAGLLEHMPEYLERASVGPDRPLFVVTDENVQEVGYADQLTAVLRNAGYSVGVGVVPPSDASKTLQTAESLYEQMVAAGLRRNGVVLALGGGMVGDLAGFVAATYYRGIPFVQVPTTLLAHDSSIGGKVGVNLKSGKNLVGAFHHPLAVVYDVSTLATLPPREWRGGMAEVIKHGLIGNPELFADLAARPVPEYPGPEFTASLVSRAIQVKIRIVERDEHESGERMKLNLGHTVGHAVEQYSGYRLNHGEAVAIGLVVEAEMAVRRGWLSGSTRDQISLVLQRHGLPTRTDNFPFEAIARLIQHDKKNVNAHWTFALPRAVGDVAVVRDVTSEEVAAAWAAVHGENGGTA
jgi:3-dehydroquinate synthase